MNNYWTTTSTGYIPTWISSSTYEKAFINYTLTK